MTRSVSALISFIGFAILMSAAPALAQDPVGTWTGESSGAGGLPVRPITLVLNADGTGTYDVGNVRPLEDVMIEGSRVAFSFRPLIGGNPAQFVFRMEGAVEGDTMTLDRYIEGGGGRRGGSEDQDPLVLTRETP